MCILDAFSNLNISFFKSTSISVTTYEYWLKLVETEEIISENEGNKIYNDKKKEKNQKKGENFIRIYKSAFEELDDADGSPRYYPSIDDDMNDSPRYYPMDDDKW